MHRDRILGQLARADVSLSTLRMSVAMIPFAEPGSFRQEEAAELVRQIGGIRDRLEAVAKSLAEDTP